MEDVSKTYHYIKNSRLRRTPSINRGRAELLTVFGKNHQLLLCL